MSATTVKLTGRIDSANAAEVEKRITAQIDGADAVTLDAEELEYISSAGLRVILRMKKSHPDLRIVNVSPEVYEILEMTGFTEMLTVEKAYRRVSVEGCEVIGEGFNGKVYRIDRDTVVKVYKNAEALDEIRHEREVARLALILGVPTAISYDVARVGESYGSVFELLDARSFAKILAEEPQRMDWCVAEYVKLLKLVHGTAVPAGKLGSIKAYTMERVLRTCAVLPAPYGDKLKAMMEAVPETDRMVHGDYHTKNIVLAGDEVLLIDMDTLAVGHPLFELAQMFNSYVGFSEPDPDQVMRFQGFSAPVAQEFWKRTLRAYLGTDDEDRIRAVEDKIRIVSYAMLADWKHRHGSDSPADREAIALWTGELMELLDRVDELTFRLPADV